MRNSNVVIHLHNHSTHHTQHKIKVCGFDITSLILTFALSFHSLFEGIAVGLTQNLETLINLIVGVAIHNGIASISLGASLALNKSISFKKALIPFLGFALS